MIKVIQLHLWGKIDPAIDFAFEPLHQMTPKELADIRKSDCDTATNYINAGVISAEESRNKLIADEHSGFNDLGEIPRQDND